MLTITPITRQYVSIDVASTLSTGAPAVISGVDVALVPPRSAPIGTTAWVPAAYSAGTATVLVAGYDADPTGALVVPAGQGADLWIRVVDSPEVTATKVFRILVLEGPSGAETVVSGTPFVTSVAGLTGIISGPALMTGLGTALTNAIDTEIAGHVTPVSDATTTAKGVVQLAGDLGGTAAAPTVPGLTGKAVLQRVAATVTASGALAVNKHNPVDATGGAKTMTLPTGQAEGTQVSVEKADASTNAVAVTGSIRGVGSSSISLVWQNEDLLLRADSAGSWWPIAGHKTKTSLDATYVPRDGSPLPVDPVPADPLHHMNLARLQKFIDWLAMGGANAKGYASETGWPGTVGPRAAEAAQWAAVAEQWYRKADAAGLWVTAWGSGSFWGTSYQLSQYIAAGGLGRPLTDPRMQASIIEAHPSTQTYLRGININGLEAAGINNSDGTGGPFSNANPLTYGVDYIAEDPASFAYLAARGIKLVRVLFRWERVQKTLGGALDSTELGRLQSVVTAARNVGIHVVICPLNYAAYWLNSGAVGNKTMISLATSNTPTAVTDAHFYDLWTRLSTTFKGDPGVYYSLMNEPGNLSGLTGAFTTTTTIAAFNDGTVGGFADDGGGAVLSNVTTGQFEGTGALALTKNWATTNFQVISKTANTTYGTAGATLQAYVYLPAGATGNAHLAVQYNSFSTTASGANVTLAPGQWTSVTFAPGATILAQQINKVQVSITTTGMPSSSQAVLVDLVRLGNIAASSTGAQAWEQLAQGALNAIRSNGDNKLVMIPTYDASNVDRVLTNHPAGPWISDPAKNIRYETHAYQDEFMSGQFSNSYAADTATAITRGY